MSRVGMTVDPYKGIPLSVLFRAVRTAGIRHAEITPQFFHSGSSVLRAVRGMRLGLHLPNAAIEGWDLSSGSRVSEIRDFIARVRGLSAEIHIEYAVCHPPESPEDERSTSLYFDSLRNLSLPLVLENIRTCTGRDFLQFHSRCKQELGDQLHGVCLDIPHAVLSGQDWRLLFLHFTSRIKVVHLSDVEGSEDRHRPFGRHSTLSLPGILRFLARQDYQGVLNFEIMPVGSLGILDMFRNIRHAQKMFE